MVVDQQSKRHLPSWLARFLAPSDLADIATTIRQIEVQTNAEIVPMVVRRSIVTGHVLPLLGLILLALYFAVDLPDRLAWWRGTHFLWSLADLVLLLLLAAGLSRWERLARLLTVDRDEEAQVLRRAELEFFEAGLDRTKGATGILLFVSLAEHRAVVLADESIAAKLPPETWQEVVSLIVRGVKSGKLAAGLTAAITRCGELVKPHFPLAADDRNELHDALIFKE